jgi:predicted small lipoprotein YifL
MRTIFLAMSLAGLSACGLKDDLYLPAPEQPPAATPAAAPGTPAGEREAGKEKKPSSAP